MRSLAAAALLLLMGCDASREGVRILGELKAVRTAVAAAVGTENVRVNLHNGEHLNIALVNTPLKSLPEDQRYAKALEIARLSYRSYASRASLKGVSVTYVVHRSYFFVVNYTDATDIFHFDATDLVEGTVADASDHASNTEWPQWRDL
jgi:hypothetical protein